MPSISRRTSIPSPVRCFPIKTGTTRPSASPPVQSIKRKRRYPRLYKRSRPGGDRAHTLTSERLSAREAVCASRFLCAVHRKDTRRDYLNSREHPGDPLFLYFGGIHVHGFCDTLAVKGQRQVAGSDENAARLEIFDRNIRQGLLALLHLEERISHSRRLRRRVGHFEQLAEFVLRPEIVAHGGADRLVPQDDDRRHVAVRNTLLLVGHQEHARPDEREAVIRVRRVEDLLVLSLDLSDPCLERRIARSGLQERRRHQTARSGFRE